MVSQDNDCIARRGRVAVGGGTSSTDAGCMFDEEFRRDRWQCSRKA